MPDSLITGHTKIETAEFSEKEHKSLFKKAIEVLAFAISAAFHPLIMPSALAWVIFYFSNGIVPLDSSGKRDLFILIVMMTLLLPGILIYMLYIFGIVKSLTMNNRSDRMIPFLLTASLYTAGTYLVFNFLRSQTALQVIMASITLNVLLCTIINRFWKISAHAIGVSGMVGLMLGLSKAYNDDSLLVPTMAVLIIGGVLCSCRLLLNAHTLNQVAAGCFIGFTTTFLATSYLI